MSARRVGVLFVCHANMCRSPLAEGVFRQLVEERGLLEAFDIDSAGTHAIEGCEPHELSREIARAHGVELSGRGRQLLRRDLERFDHLVVMDRRNRDTILQLVGRGAFEGPQGYQCRLRTLREISDPRARGADLDVPDPISKGRERYVEIYGLIRAGCEALLEELGT